MAVSRRQNRHLARRPRSLAESVSTTLTRTFETLVCRLFQDSVQFRSGLVDLVVGVGRHGGGGHRFTLTREGFVGLTTQHLAQVGDHGAGLGERQRLTGLSANPAMVAAGS